ncbi:MAG: hypothetical protein Fur002_09480 [Anaerolineales bacterium]
MWKKFLLAFTLMFTALNLYAALRYELPYPLPLGPALDAHIRTNHLRAVEEKRPQLVLIGDSTLTKGVNPKRLSENLGKPIYSIDLPGSASTLWYLIIKNNLMEAKTPPPYLLIFFRDTVLTLPDYRVEGEYFTQIDEYASPKDALLIERAYVNQMSPLEQAAASYLPLYGARREMRVSLDELIRYAPAQALLNCERACVREALSVPFGSARNEQALNAAIYVADESLYSPRSLNFARQAPRSFLPEIIRMAQEQNVQLILVRMKTREFHQRFPALENYMRDLSAYAQANGVILMDYGADPRLTEDLYADTLHLNGKGEAAFTEILSADLAPLLR